jgi:phosphate transport system substrate-binding protein
MKKLYFFSLVALMYACTPRGGDQQEGKDTAAASEGGSGMKGSVQIDGSSTVFPITEAVAEEYNASNPEVKVTVGVSGTGGGFKKLIRKEIDVANASRPVSKDELEQLKAAGIEVVELPIAYDGLAVVVHPSNTWVDYLTVEELKKMWEPSAQGKITKWSQIRKGWPDKELHLFGAGSASGTFDYFTEAIVGKAKSSRGDYNANEDDNVLVNGVAEDQQSLGFFGLEYYLQAKDKLKLVPIDDKNDANGKGAVVPTAETVKNGTYQPLSRPLFIYIRKESLGNEAVKSFADFYTVKAGELVTEAGYIPLTPEVYNLVKTRLKNQTAGSAFAGLESNVGIKMEEVLK